MSKVSFRRTERLDCLYDQLLPGEEVWDVCCDHGYLGLRALSSGLFPRVHFVDQAAHLMDRLQKRVGLASQAYFYSKSIQEVRIPIAGTFVIAGVGGLNLLEMLRAQLSSTDFQPRRLVLAPHRDELKVRQFLEDQALGPVSSLSVQEGARCRWIYVLDLKHDS